MAKGTRPDDDAGMFEKAMEQLGTKRSARAEPRPEKPRPAGVTVSEDIDFDALMREGRGPAKEVGPERRRGPVLDEAERSGAEEERGTNAPERGHPIVRSRYAASADESREFLSAMQELGSVPGDRAAEELPAKPRSKDAGDDLARRLKRADVEPDAVLDLHGKNQKEARARLAAFIAEASREGWEIVAIVVGRGVHSDRGEAVLRPLVEKWLAEDHRTEVREVHAAPSYLGGSGAWIAALRRGA